MSFRNLINGAGQTNNPYIHMSPRNLYYVAEDLNLGGWNTSADQNPYKDGIIKLQSLSARAKEREKLFFSRFGMGPDDAPRWSDKFLARKSENSSFEQQVASAWNSSAMRTAISGLKSPQEIQEELRKKLTVRAKDIGEEITSQFLDKVDKAQTAKELQDLFFNFMLSNNENLSVQRAIRSAITNAPVSKRTRLLTSKNSRVIQNLFNDIAKSRSRDEKYMKNVENTFYQEVSRQSGIAISELKKKPYSTTLKPYFDLLDKAKRNEEDYMDLLKNNFSVQIGAIDELGTEILLKTEFEKIFGQDFNIKREGNKLVSRFDQREVKSKTDMIIDLPQAKDFRFQQKNTDKDIFSDLEEFGTSQVASLNRIFFTAGSTVYYKTIKEQAQMMQGSTISNENWDTLTYLICNLAVLQKYFQGNEKGTTNVSNKNKSYAVDTEDRKGLYLEETRNIVAKILSQAILLWIADFTKQDPTGLFIAQPYDFIIFQSRFLFPVSWLYDGIIKSLQDYQSNIQNQATGLHIDYGVYNFPYETMVEEKKAAVPEGFIPLRQGGKYDDSNLVNVGRSAGKQAYDNLYISQVKFNFDFSPYWENLVKTRNL